MRGEAAAHMIEGGRGGVIINISSIPRGQCRSDQLLRRESWRCRHDGDLGEETRAPPDPRGRHRARILRYANGGKDTAKNNRKDCIDNSALAACQA